MAAKRKQSTSPAKGSQPSGKNAKPILLRLEQSDRDLIEQTALAEERSLSAQVRVLMAPELIRLRAGQNT